MPDLRLALIVEAIDRFSAPFRKMRDALTLPAEVGRSLSEASDRLARFSEGFAGFAATVGAGFELNDIIKEQDAFTRIGVDAGVSKDRVEELKQSLYGMAQKWGTGIDPLRAGVREMFDQFQDGKEGIARAEDAVEVLAMSMQRLAGHGPELGKLFGVLERFGGLKGPSDLLAAMAMLRAEIGPNSQWNADFASVAPPILQEYIDRARVHATSVVPDIGGMQALRDLGAVYGALRPVSRTPRQAMGEMQQLIDRLSTDQILRGLLMSEGVGVVGKTLAEQNANIFAGHIAPLSEWFGDFVKAMQSQRLPGIILDQVMGTELRDALAKMNPADIVANFKAVADPTQYARDAAATADTLASSLTRVGTSLHQIADSYAAGPLNLVADALDRFPKVVSVTVTSLAGLAVMGMVAGWATRLKPLVTGLGGAFVSTAAFVRDFFEGIALGLPALGSLDIALAADPIGAVAAGALVLAGAGYEVYEHWDQVLGLFRSLNREWTQLASHLPAWAGGGSTAWGHWDQVGNRPVWRHDTTAPASEAQNGYWATIGNRQVWRAGAAPASTIGSEKNAPQNVETNSTVTVRFENAPPSLRVKKVESGLGTSIRTELGYLLGAL